MTLLKALVAAAGLALAAGEQTPATELEGLRENIRSSLKSLAHELHPLENLTAEYSGDVPPAELAQRDVLRGKVEEEVSRLDNANAKFWPLWDAQRMAQGAMLMGSVLRGSGKPEEGSEFLDETDIEDFKADFSRMRDRARAALDREAAAHGAYLDRERARREERWLAAGAGLLAGAAA
ncbi:hypothetical protein EPO15_12735, partial [bacterium]